MTLDELRPRIDEYIRFAKQFPASYRVGIVNHLLSSNVSKTAAGDGVAPNREGFAPQEQSLEQTVDAEAVLAELERETRVPADELKLLTAISPSGQVSIRAMLTDDSDSK